jgi:ATP-binding cassette subfamily B protein/subfamily B ATP-binding cassette protein MsbA
VTLIYKYISLYFTKSIIVQTKKTVFDKLARNDYRYFVDNKRGDILYSVITAPGKIRDFLENTTLMFSDIVVILTIFTILFVISPAGFALMIIAALLFMLSVRVVGKRKAYRLGELQLSSIQSENDVINNYIQGLRQIRSVAGDIFWKEKYNNALDNYWNKFIKYSIFKHLPGILLHFFFFSLIAILVIVLYYTYKENFLYIIPLVGTFAFAAIKILPRLSSFGKSYIDAMDCWPNLKTVYNFTTDSRYHLLKNGSIIFERLTEDIVFENVQFSYDPPQPLINNMNLTIERNKVTALVGHSGSGKSTIVSLLLRYYDVSGGSIQLNGIDLREYDLKSFLQKVGYVSQDAFIYNASIWENISFGGHYTEEQIKKAAEKANIDLFINNLPEGYCAVVGDQGLKLSGGEKQRIAIARALVREPDILVLDEATSNLDNKSEAAVQDSINQIAQNITTFMIAHRLSTIKKADMIYVMSGGRIVENGTHNSLMEKKGRYYELYKSGE